MKRKQSAKVKKTGKKTAARSPRKSGGSTRAAAGSRTSAQVVPALEPPAKAKKPRSAPKAPIRPSLPRERVKTRRALQKTPRRVPATPPSLGERLRRSFRLTLTVWRYVGIEILRVVFLSVFAISLIGTVVLAVQLVRNGIHLEFIWSVLFKSLAYPLFFSLPISFLFGITLGMGRLAGDHEINALRAGGFSYVQVSVPAIFLSFLLTAFALHLNGTVIPEIHYERGNLRDAILKQLEGLGSGKDRSLLLPAKARLFVKSYSGTRLKGIYLEIQGRLRNELARNLRSKLIRPRFKKGEPSPLTLVAKQCDLGIALDRSKIILNLRDPVILVPQEVLNTDRRPDVFRQRYAIKGSVVLDLPFLRKGERCKDLSWNGLFERREKLLDKLAAREREQRDFKPVEKPRPAAKVSGEEKGGPEEDGEEEAVAELEALRREIVTTRRRIYQTETEVHRRGAFSLACFSFPFVGLPLVFLTDRRSRLIPFFFGNVLVVLPFFLLVMLGVLLGERGFPASVALAVPNLFVVGIALFLWKKVLKR